jgi:hypothetical protein
MAKRIILGVGINSRMESVPQVQQILTEYGCIIKTRLGLHNVSDNACSAGGLLILEMFGEEAPISEMESKLTGLSGIQVQKMVFEE